MHTNSGVGNKAAYLITDGGAFGSQTVRGLGVDAAAAIFYQAAGLLGPTSRYRDLGNALTQGCTNLVGSAPVGSSTITADDCAQVTAAVEATRMGFVPAGPNRPPRAPDLRVATDAGRAVRVDVLAGVDDPDGDPVTLDSWSNGDRGSVTCAASGSCLYTPRAGADGPDAFDYAVRDARGATAVGTVRVSIADADGGPAAAAVRDSVRLERTGAVRYSFRQALRSGDIDVTRRAGKIRAIRGKGKLAPNLSVSFDLTVRKGRASGTIKVRDLRSGLVDRIPVSRDRLTVGGANGRKVRATVRWTVRRNGTAQAQRLVWSLTDRRR